MVRICSPIASVLAPSWALILNSTPEGDSGGGKVPGGFHGVLKFRGVGGVVQLPGSGSAYSIHKAQEGTGPRQQVKMPSPLFRKRITNQFVFWHKRRSGPKTVLGASFEMMNTGGITSGSGNTRNPNTNTSILRIIID